MPNDPIVKYTIPLCCLEIERIVVARETEDYVWVDDDEYVSPLARKGEFANCYETWQEARDALLAPIELRCAVARNSLARAEEARKAVLALQDPAEQRKTNGE